jgi:hypothetical protein
MPALDHDFAFIARGVGEFSIPAALLCNLRFDIQHGNVTTSPEQVVTPAPDRLLARIPVQDHRSMIPVRNAAADLPRKYRVVRLIEKVGLAPEQLLGTFARVDILNNGGGFCGFLPDRGPPQR